MWLNLTLVSLKQISKKIKAFYHSYIRKLIWLWIVFLSLINSYILGSISNYNNDFQRLEIIQNNDLKISNDLKNNSYDKNHTQKGSIVASKNGTKYYFLWCGGVSRINEENKIYFKSENSAILDGYEKASGCE